MYIDFSNALWGTGAVNIKAQIWGGSNGDVYFYSGGSGWSTIEIESKTYVALDMTGNQDFTGMQVYAWDYSSQGNISESISPSSFSGGKNLIIVGNSGDWTVKQPVTFGTLDVGTTYTVTKYAVYDGVVDTQYPLGSDEVSAGGTYAVPDRINKTGYHFGGWYTNVECTSAYVASEINADTSLYAKYTSFSKDSYIYYVTGSESATPNSIHSWGGDFELDGLVTAVSGVAEVQGVFHFRGTAQKIYRIPFSSEAGDTAFKFHYSDWESESPEKALTSGNAYKWEADANFDEAAAGDALDLIIRVENARNAASYETHNYSICGISPATAAQLWNDYYALDGTAKGYIDESTTYTYKGRQASGEFDWDQDNISFANIMLQLKAIAVKGGQAVNGGNELTISNGHTVNYAPIAIIASSIAIVSLLGAGLMIKRRKEDR